MIKKVLVFFFIFLLTLVFGGYVVKAVSNNKPDIPEVAGLYDDPTHPGVKVRVFVYHAKPTDKPSKPSPTPTPSLSCGLDDPLSTSQDAPAGWKLDSSVTYNLNPDSVPSSVGSSNLSIMATDAFYRWSNATGNKVYFNPGSTTTTNRQAYDGQNIIAWGRTSGTALAVTYVRYYTSTGQVVDVDTIMNNKFPWSWDSNLSCAYPGSYNAQDILTHELGHWLGLDDMYANSYVNNTMYGYGSTEEIKKITLENGDETAAYNIYNP